MKLHITILFTLLFIVFSGPLKASHNVGGEMGWVCLPNGKYHFYMSLFMDCSSTQWRYENETIQIVGNPLPTDASGSALSTIIVKPDSNRWENENRGDIAPKCTNAYGDPLSCAERDDVVFQERFYISDTMELRGVPPVDGWKFYWRAPCCRSTYNNTIHIELQSLLLRAFMYPTANKDDVNPCIDSSPEFRALPVSAVCRGDEFTYNTVAIDNDLDSLSYKLDKAINEPLSNPLDVVYKNGYSFDNPTPDTSFDIKNSAAQINSQSGNLDFGIYSGSGIEKFLLVIRVDAYREGKVISSVFREQPIAVQDCPKLPSGIIVNQSPEIKLNGVITSNYHLNVFAGEEVKVSVEVKDTNKTGVGSGFQKITLVPDGLMFSADKINPIPCNVTGMLVDPCAYLTDQVPFLDNTEDPPVYKIEGLGEISSEFVWQADCQHVKTKIGISGTRKELYSFILKVTDDHCPLPSINYATINVEVLEPSILSEPIVKGASVGLDGKVTYQWAAPLDSVNTFHAYKVEVATTQEEFVPNFWARIEDELEKYNYSEKYESDFGVYRNINNNPAFGSDILTKNMGPSGLGLDWYLRMTTISGCADTSESKPSEAVRVIELNTIPGGNFPAPTRGVVDFNWNRAKPLSASTKPYFKYDSPTTFYIWENDSISSVEVDVAENWYIRGSTQQTTYNAESNVCGRMVGFRVEARDTIISWKQGKGLGSDSLDTLTFSTFSVIDTFFMVQNEVIPKPVFDTIQVLENGDVYLKVDVANAGTIEEFKIFENNTSGAELTSFNRSIESSFTVVGADANTASRKYLMQAVDACSSSVLGNGDVYTTIHLDGSLLTPCPPVYRINWNQPTGFPNGIQSYKVYSQRGNEAQKLRAVISDPITTNVDLTIYGRGLDYEFQVVAVDEDGAVNISAIHDYITPMTLRTDEKVPAPDLKCITTNSDGSVTLLFNTPRDSTNNRVAYEFEYREVGVSTWIPFGGSSLVDPADSSVVVTGVNTNQSLYEFAARTRSGCDETFLSSYSIISMERDFIYAFMDTLKTDLAAKGYQWYNCTTNQLIPNAISSSFLPKDTGYYAVIVDNGKCIDTSNCFFYNPLGVAKNKEFSQYRLYPNPTNGKFFIVTNSNTQQLTVVIRNIQGQLIEEQLFVGQQQWEVDIKGAPGVYFIQLTNDKKEHVNLKVIKR